MSLEAKVGAFVLGGLILLGTAIFLLGDFSMEPRYSISVTFHDVGNLSKDAPVKLSGVEVGKVKGLVLEHGLAKAVCQIRKGVDIYKGAHFTVASTGIIGSKYLAVEQGNLSQGLIEAGATLQGDDPVMLEKAMTKALGSLETMLGELTAKGPRGSLTENLRETVANVRELTANLNDLIETTKPGLEKAIDRTDAITAKLDDLLAKSNTMMASLSTDKGAIGALLHDPQVKEDVKITITSVKDAASTAKDVFGRITQFHTWWNLDWRYDALIRTSHADVGLKISPRPGRYYYIGGANLANVNDSTRRGIDYAPPNRVDGLLGFEGQVLGKGPYVDVAVGAIRSSGGARLTVTPFYRKPVGNEDPFGNRFSVMAQGYEFGRNRQYKGHQFSHPEFDFGLLARLTKWLGIGARVEDVQEVPRFHTWANVMWEDQDVAYLFGLATFGAATTKGRSKSK
ncbi:MAG: MlaD family protein [Elusimicrobia bacterium]|nr:MlaD family protein [Elusimicrobiota bacterium]